MTPHAYARITLFACLCSAGFAQAAEQNPPHDLGEVTGKPSRRCISAREETPSINIIGPVNNALLRLIDEASSVDDKAATGAVRIQEFYGGLGFPSVGQYRYSNKGEVYEFIAFTVPSSYAGTERTYVFLPIQLGDGQTTAFDGVYISPDDVLHAKAFHCGYADNPPQWRWVQYDLRAKFGPKN